MGRWDVAGGAFLLFLTNAVTIAFAAMLVFFALGFAPIRESGRKVPRALAISAVFTLILLIPLTFLSASFFRKAPMTVRSTRWWRRGRQLRRRVDGSCNPYRKGIPYT